MASKRKSAVPVKASDEKRQELSWDMTDMLAPLSNTLLIVNSNDVPPPDICNPDSPKSALNSESNIDDELRSLIDKCDFYISIGGGGGSQQPLAVDGNDQCSRQHWSALLGRFELALMDVPKSLTGFLSCLFDLVTEFWLYVDVSSGEHLVYIMLSSAVDLPMQEKELKSKQKKFVSKRNVAHGKNYVNSNVMYFHTSTALPGRCFDGFQSKKEFRLQLASFKAEAGTLTIDIYVLEPALLTLSFASESIKPRRCHNTIQQLVQYFFGAHDEGLLINL